MFERHDFCSSYCKFEFELQKGAQRSGPELGCLQMQSWCLALNKPHHIPSTQLRQPNRCVVTRHGIQVNKTAAGIWKPILVVVIESSRAFSGSSTACGGTSLPQIRREFMPDSLPLT